MIFLKGIIIKILKLLKPCKLLGTIKNKNVNYLRGETVEIIIFYWIGYCNYSTSNRMFIKGL